MQAEDPKVQPLHKSWVNSQVPPNLLNAENILGYFMDHHNPFYDNKCLNEIVRMQRATVNLDSMEGVQYKLFQALEPLFVIKKVIRKRNIARPQTFDETPLADYYIINGTVYQAPDLASVINSRVLTALCNIQASFAEARSYSRYHPSKGYWWEFEKPGPSLVPKRRASRVNSSREEEPSTSSERKREKSGSAKRDSNNKPPQDVRTTLFQRTRVDALLGLLTEQFPPIETETEEKPTIPPDDTSSRNAGDDGRSESGSGFGGVKRELGFAADGRGPPKKKPKIEDS